MCVGRAGGRTLLEVGVWSPLRVGIESPGGGRAKGWGEGFEIPRNTPWGKRGSPEALPLPRSWFIFYLVYKARSVEVVVVFGLESV